MNVVVPTPEMAVERPHIHQDIREWLQRPVRAETYTWTSSLVRGSVFNCFDPLRTSLARPSNWSKLLGFQYIRCTARVRFQVTGNAFMGGKLRAVWIPVNKIGAYTSALSPPNLTMISGVQQGVDIYPTDNAMYELQIPLIIPNRYFDLSKAKYDWAAFDIRNQPTASFGPSYDFLSLGLVAVYIVSPLVTESPADSCSVVSFVTLDNVEIADCYTSLQFDPPSNASPPLTLANAAASDDFSSLAYLNASQADIAPQLYHNARSESLNVPPRKTGESSKEPKIKTETGFLTNLTSMVSKAAAAVIPFAGPLAPYATGASVISGALSSIFRFFNLDKPVLNQVTKEFMLRWRNMAFGDGNASSARLSLLSGNAVSPVGVNQPFNPNDLSISYMCSIPQLVAWRKISTSNSPLDRILNWAVSPGNCMTQPTNTTSGGMTPVTFPTFSSHVNSCFEYWRGDLVVEVEVVAQGFSKCAIGVSWIPSSEVSADNFYPLPNQSIFPEVMTECLTKIINVSGTTCETFKVPFLNSEYALRSDINTVANKLNGSGGAFQSWPFANGFIVIYLVNPLTNFSPSVPDANTVDVLLYAHWENLAFYRPTSDRLNAWPATFKPEIQSNGGFGDSDSPDSALDLDEPEYYLNSFDTPVYDAGLLNPNEFFGEYTDSVLDLARRPGSMARLLYDPQQDNRRVYYNFSLFRPVSLPSPASNPQRSLTHNVKIANKSPLSSVSNNFVEFLSSLYVTWRGEVCYTALNLGDFADAFDGYWISLSNYNFKNQYAFELSRTFPNPGVGQSNPSSLFGSGTYYRPGSNPANPPSISVPYYSPDNFMFTPDLVIAGSKTIATCYNYRGVPGATLSLQALNTSVTPPTLMVEAGDRFSYGLLYPPRTNRSYITYRCVNDVIPSSSPQPV